MSLTKQFLDDLSTEQVADRLSLALAGANLGIWDWDLRDDSVQFDRRWCEMLGLDLASTPMTLETWSSRVHPADIDDCYRDIQAHLSGATASYENVHRIMHADGQWRYILDRGRISGRDAEGKPIRFTGTHLDLTASESARRDAERQQQELAELIAHLPMAVALLDHELRYVAASEEWIVAQGLGGIAVRGRRHIDLKPDTSPHWHRILERALAGDTVGEDEQLLTGPDGLMRWYGWSVRPWRRGGAISGVLVTFKNVTSAVTRRLEQEQEQEQTARLAGLAVFAGGVSHEINTPLQVIGLAADVLEKELESRAPDTERLLEAVRSIGVMSARAAAITGALRVLARDARFDAEEPVPLADLLEHARALCESRFESRGITLAFANACGPETVSGRPAELLRMLLNLLDNAYDAALLDGRWVRVEARRDGDRIVIRVVDGGAGIAPGIVDRMWEPYFSTKHGGGGAAPGSGVGLSVLRSLAERGRGSVAYLADEPDTTFELRLPIGGSKATP